MIHPDQIPDEAVEAAAIRIMSGSMLSQTDAEQLWSGLFETEKASFRRKARAAIAAALGAWPEMYTAGNVAGSYAFLPLPTEASDEHSV